MEICAIGGFEEVGKNMTAVKIKDEVYIFDCGFYLPGVIELQEEPEEEYNLRGLRRVGAIPDDRILDKLGWRKDVKAIFLSHAHLDHVGGLQYLIHRYPGIPVYGTPFTMEVFKALKSDSKINVTNPLKIVEQSTPYKIKRSNQSINVEFVHVTHSTIDCSFVVLHTPEGIFFYALDYKFDDAPTFGPPTNYERLKQIGEKGVKVAIINTLYSSKDDSNGTETDAKNMLQQAFAKIKDKNSAFFITTFSSHIERLNNIVNLALKTKREVIFLGRSLARYVECANKVGKCPFRNKIKLLKYRKQVNSFLNRLNNDRNKYVIVCTGHQGEKNSILDRISRAQTPFHFKPGDNLIFSTSVIPTEVNILARQMLDKKLEEIGVVLQKNVHVHGHGSKESKKKLLRLVKPEHIIPAHGTVEQEKPLIEVAKEFGYSLGKTSHLASNGSVLKV